MSASRITEYLTTVIEYPPPRMDWPSFSSALRDPAMSEHHQRAMLGRVTLKLMREQWSLRKIQLWIKRVQTFGIAHAEIDDTDTDAAAFRIWRDKYDDGSPGVAKEAVVQSVETLMQSLRDKLEDVEEAKKSQVEWRRQLIR